MWRLEPTDLAKPGKSRRLTGTGTGFARQEALVRVFGLFWNRTEPFFWSKPGPLGGYPDPLLTLVDGGLPDHRDGESDYKQIDEQLAEKMMEDVQREWSVA
jgi:hypothetical protein